MHIRKKVFTISMVRHWHRWDALSLEAPKVKLEGL